MKYGNVGIVRHFDYRFTSQLSWYTNHRLLHNFIYVHGNLYVDICSDELFFFFPSLDSFLQVPLRCMPSWHMASSLAQLSHASTTPALKQWWSPIPSLRRRRWNTVLKYRWGCRRVSCGFDNITQNTCTDEDLFCLSSPCEKVDTDKPSNILTSHSGSLITETTRWLNRTIWVLK